MKRISIILFAMLAFVATASAQRINFEVGGGLASHYGSGTRNIGSFRLGVSYEYEMPGNLSIEPGIFFSAKGYKNKNEKVFLRDASGNIVCDDQGNARTGVKNCTTNANYIEVPVMVNYYFELSQLHYLEISVGPYAAYGVGGKRTTRGDTDKSASQRYYYAKHTFDEQGVHKFDGGIEAAVTYEFNRTFAVGVSTDLGLLNFNTSGAKNISALATFSYRFRLGE